MYDKQIAYLSSNQRRTHMISSADCLRKLNHSQKVGQLYRSFDAGFMLVDLIWCTFPTVFITLKPLGASFHIPLLSFPFPLFFLLPFFFSGSLYSECSYFWRALSFSTEAGAKPQLLSISGLAAPEKYRIWKWAPRSWKPPSPTFVMGYLLLGWCRCVCIAMSHTVAGSHRPTSFFVDYRYMYHIRPFDGISFPLRFHSYNFIWTNIWLLFCVYLLALPAVMICLLSLLAKRRIYNELLWRTTMLFDIMY